MPVTTTTTETPRAARSAVSQAIAGYSTDTTRHHAFAALLHLSGDRKTQFPSVLAPLCAEYNPAPREADLIEAMAVYRWHQSLWASRKNALLADAARAEQSGSEEAQRALSRATTKHRNLSHAGWPRRGPFCACSSKALSALRQRHGSFVERNEKVEAWARWETRAERNFNRARKHYLDQKRRFF